VTETRTPPQTPPSTRARTYAPSALSLSSQAISILECVIRWTS